MHDHISFVPEVLPIAPRPIAGELISSWLLRVSFANGLTLAELVQGIEARFPEVPLQGAFIDEQLSPSARSVLAKFLRVTEHQVKALELRQQFPTLPMEWILRSIDWELGSPHRFVQGRAMYKFCPICIQEMSRSTRTVWIRSEWAFVFQTHCARHRTPLLETCGVCFREDPLAITNPPVRDKSFQLASCWNCGSSLLFYDPEPPASPTVREIIDLESAILTAVLGKSPDPRWSGRLCAKAFTEKLRFLMQHLTTTTATNDPLPLFFRIADADPHLRRYLFGRQRPGTRMEAMSWYWRFLLMIILARRLNSRESGLSTI
jgi:TniQ protein